MLTAAEQKQTAETILKQIGRGALYMIGMKNPVFHLEENTGILHLTFSIMQNPKKVKWIRISYLPGKDLYNIEFLDKKGASLSELENIYAENLKSAIKDGTGLAVSLSGKGKKTLQRRRGKYYNKSKATGHFPGCTKAGTAGAPAMKKTKKRLSARQRAALAKGRKVLKGLRKGRKISEPKEPIVLKKGEIVMDGRKSKKSRRKTAKRYHGGEFGRKKYHGGEFGRRKRRSRKAGRFLGEFGGGFDLAGIGTDAAGIVAGAVGASFVTRLIPIKQTLLQALVPIALGGFVVSNPKWSKQRLINRIGLGALAVGGLAITKALAPKLPLLSGADTAEGVGIAIDNLPAEEKAILGLLPDYSGEAGTDYQGTDYQGAEPGEMLGNQPGEMLGTDYQGTEYTGGAEPGEMLGEDFEAVTSGEDGEDFE